MKKFMSLTINAVLYILVLTGSYSCLDGGYTYIPQERKPILQNEDTVFFKSNENKIDTFSIYRNDFFEESDSKYYDETIYIIYSLLNHNRKFDFFWVHQSASSSLISCDARYFPSTREYETYEISINGKKYYSVYYLHTDMLSDSIPNTIYYCYKYGILRYDFSDGEHFELMDKK